MNFEDNSGKSDDLLEKTKKLLKKESGKDDYEPTQDEINARIEVINRAIKLGLHPDTAPIDVLKTFASKLGIRIDDTDDVSRLDSKLSQWRKRHKLHPDAPIEEYFARGQEPNQSTYLKNLGYNRLERMLNRGNIDPATIERRRKDLAVAAQFDQLINHQFFPDKRNIVYKLGDAIRKPFKPYIKSYERKPIMKRYGAEKYIQKINQSAELFAKVGFNPETPKDYVNGYLLRKARRKARDIEDSKTLLNGDPSFVSVRQLRNAQYDRFVSNNWLRKALLVKPVSKRLVWAKNRLFTTNKFVKDVPVKRRWETTKKITKKVKQTFTYGALAPVGVAGSLLYGVGKGLFDFYKVLSSDGTAGGGGDKKK